LNKIVDVIYHFQFEGNLSDILFIRDLVQMYEIPVESEIIPRNVRYSMILTEKREPVIPIRVFIIY